MSYTDEQIAEVVGLKDKGTKHRDISEQVFGTRSSASSVHNILKRYHPEYVEGKEPEGLLKIVSFDIETSPMKSYHWGLFKQFIALNQIVDNWYPLCFSYKELGKPVQRHSLRGFPNYVSGNDNERLLVEACWEVLDDADIIVAHNGRRFDVKKMNAKFLEFGLPRPSPYKVVDTLEIAKSNFALTSNKLDYIMSLLLNDNKMETGGFGLWIGCMNGNHEDWDKMESYCDKDTTGLEEVYMIMRHWDKRHPNIAMNIDDGKEHCTVCGSSELTVLDKNADTGISSFEALRCDGCGHINRRRKNTRSKDQMKNTLMNYAG